MGLTKRKSKTPAGVSAKAAVYCFEPGPVEALEKCTAISYKTYPSTFTLVTGPLFRLNVDKAVSAGTVGIDVGFINSPFKGVISKYFAAQLKIGIPINALIK